MRTALFLLALAAAPAARALDPFEIQVYDGSANKQGVFGLELHLNYVARGLSSADAPELPLDHQFHATLEPSYGLTSWWELGGYLQTALRSDGVYDYAGVKLRSKFVLPGEGPLKLGLNFELSLLPERYDRERVGGEVRPIVGWESDSYIAVANPIVEVSFQHGPSVQPALTLLRKLGHVALGLESYSKFGPHPEHYLYEVVTLIGFDAIEIHAGLGEGLTSDSQPLTAKLILGYSFERP